MQIFFASARRNGNSLPWNLTIMSFVPDAGIFQVVTGDAYTSRAKVLGSTVTNCFWPPIVGLPFTYINSADGAPQSARDSGSAACETPARRKTPANIETSSFFTEQASPVPRCAARQALKIHA